MSPSRNPNSFNLDSEPIASLPKIEGSPRPRKRAGFFVPLNPETGEIDLSRANPEQLAKLQTIVATKSAEKEPEKPRPEFNPEFIPYAYGLLEVIIQRVGKLLLKWPPQLAAEMTFSKDKVEKMVEPTKALLDQFAPTWLIENQAIAAFGMGFADLMNDMVTKGTERYMIKVIRGEAPLPPGVKLEIPVPRNAPPAPARVTGEPPRAVEPPSISADKSNGVASQPVYPSGVRGFVPNVPAGAIA